ncbi:MerR family DNA-binding transcriptional regulator [Clostridium chromiireducens]|uniref:MerR family DNA-binding transcriptional regulator n=1 Tax=Clostridium chromiireducens TaxID=225345 RepID=A0A964RPW3_9CLOT|nr:MerR family transcriptional regulator [Clostridium chromiireducens]MVX65592.1 MerR family DNA-binding transcriptional regulator [Clostridium chromiireducens]
MLINEVCRLTGLTKKAISCYEQQGLIKPIRGTNRYREYSQNIEKNTIKYVYSILLQGVVLPTR